MSEPIAEMAVIRTRSERQAMDWALVLASQGIDVTPERDQIDATWFLLVSPVDASRARAAIRQYRIENRGFEWQHELPGSDFWFDGRAIFWALIIVFVFLWSGGPHPSGIFDIEQVHQGEWWRVVTAEWLHRDIAHLFSNVAMGIVFLGLAMARFGVGVALLGSLAAGALANASGLLVRGDDFAGVGASGMIMGALGMVVAQAAPRWRQGRRGNRAVLVGLGTGAIFFILFGADPSSDVFAHAAGLIFGIMLGAMAAWLPPATLSRVNLSALVLFVLITLGTWCLALVR